MVVQFTINRIFKFFNNFIVLLGTYDAAMRGAKEAEDTSDIQSEDPSNGGRGCRK